VVELKMLDTREPEYKPHS